MAIGESSFDVVSQFNRQELVNAVDQALREVHTRYDLKDSGTTIELEATALKLHSATEMTLEAARDVLLTRAVKRQLSPKIFDYGKIEEASKGTVRQTASLRQGLSQDLAREITKLIRDRLPKLKTQIQGDAVRVTGKSKDELQAAIQLLRKMEVDRDWPVPLQFVNYR
jgi:cyclic-di-GMP-binding protein